MSAGKHTPGPWVAKRLNEKDMREHQALWSISRNGLGWWLATVPTGNPEQAGADAALIAAAPDLYDAAQPFRGTAADPQPGEMYTLKVLGEELVALRAALKKARGE